LLVCSVHQMSCSAHQPKDDNDCYNPSHDSYINPIQRSFWMDNDTQNQNQMSIIQPK
jgi:hypothetical protein